MLVRYRMVDRLDLKLRTMGTQINELGNLIGVILYASVEKRRVGFRHKSFHEYELCAYCFVSIFNCFTVI